MTATDRTAVTDICSDCSIPGMERGIVMNVLAVRLSVRERISRTTRPIFANFCACYLCPLRSSSVALRYVMYNVPFPYLKWPPGQPTRPESTRQTASRLVQPFLHHGCQSVPTDSQAYSHAYRPRCVKTSVAICRIELVLRCVLKLRS